MTQVHANQPGSQTHQWIFNYIGQYIFPSPYLQLSDLFKAGYKKGQAQVWVQVNECARSQVTEWNENQ